MTIAGKTLRIRYASPSVRGRKIFGAGGLLSMDPTYPVWRAGANSATAFHTDAALDIAGLAVPKGDYTLYANVADPEAVKAMVAAMCKAGVPAEVSNSAGTFVCNHLLYGVLHFLAASGRKARAGFIHVPWLEEQALNHPGQPTMALATMARGAEIAIAAALATSIDVKMAAGKIA